MLFRLILASVIILFSNKLLVAADFSAELNTPSGDGPFPTIIISHGSGGLTGLQTSWAEYFNSLGYATITMDHYGPRGWSRGQRPPKGAEARDWRYFDLIGALRKFKSNKKIDQKRIVLAGWSAGSAMTMWGLNKGKEIREESGISHPFKAGILFYPWMYSCNFGFDKITFPIIHLHGSDDATYENCWKSNVEDMKSEKFELVSKVYDGAVHLFDSPFAPDRCRTVRVSRNSPYSNYELCYRYDSEAHDQSKKDIKAFLARHLSD